MKHAENHELRQTVVMLVANDVSIDIRVKKMAASVSRTHDVTVLGLSNGTSRSTYQTDGFNVILVPVLKPKPLIKRVRSIAGKIILRIPMGLKFRNLVKSSKTTKAISPAPNLTDKKLNWREVLQETSRYETAFGMELEKLSPEIVHAQDIHLLGVASNYKQSMSDKGKKVSLIYDAHEYIRGLGSIDPQRRDAYAELETEFIGQADAVITVSDSIAKRIQSDHELLAKPFLVLNAPSQSRIQVTDSSPSVRKVCNLGPEVPLVIYSGGIHISRGMDLLVSSLEFMPDVHLAMTTNRESWYIEELRDKAAKFNGADRLHFVPYVAPEEVVPYISTATVGISPLPADVVNYDLALPNKLFDYMQAKLPIISSDCFEVSELLSKYPLGEVFDWQDPKALAAAVKAAIEKKSEIIQVYESLATELENFTWEYQEVELEKAYAAAQIPTVNQ
jgi:glycosyltransferase involved in cell wall biosynthesis